MLTILWDASHLWGYLLWHAARAAGIPHRVIQASDIAQEGLSGKVLAVPGGPARYKMKALGKDGVRAVRAFVQEGGHYLGFCGGAGMALADGLGLCPWHRAGMSDRLQHLVSGYVQCELKPHPLSPPGMSTAFLPVWWPGRFQEPEGHDGKNAEDDGVRVLARYCAPGPDLHVADLPLSMLAPDVLAEWSEVYGVHVRPSLLDGQPCVLTGTFGRGDWLLSYSHLETPVNAQEDGGRTPARVLPQGEEICPACADDDIGRDAGRWFFHVLEHWMGPLGDNTAKHAGYIAPFVPEAEALRWDDPVLLEARQGMAELTRLGLDLGLLFPRASWLMGWKSGMPGAQFNSMRLAVLAATALEPSAKRRAVWREKKEDFAVRFRLFMQGARSWMLARRLADTLADALADSRPGVLPKSLLTDQRRMLFGSPMSNDGLCGTLLEDMESLLFIR